MSASSTFTRRNPLSRDTEFITKLVCIKKPLFYLCFIKDIVSFFKLFCQTVILCIINDLFFKQINSQLKYL